MNVFTLCREMKKTILHIAFRLLFGLGCLLLFLLPRLNAQSLDSILQDAWRQRAQHLKQYQAFETTFLETCEAKVVQVPFNIWPVSGVLIPADKDTGLAYRSEAKIKAKYLDRFHYQQDVIIKREAGTLPIPNWHQLPAYNFNLLERRIYLNEAFDRGFASPLHASAAPLYDYHLVSSKLRHGLLVHRIAFKPKKAKYPALSGTVDLIDSIGLPIAAHFSISSNNQLELMDSISVFQIFSYADGIYRAEEQSIELHLNLFNFQGFYRINLDYQEFKYHRSIPEEDFDKLVFHQDKEDFKPDTSYWRSLGNSKETESYFKKHLIDANPQKQFRSFGTSRLDPGPFIWYKNFYRGYTRRWGDYFLDLPPIYKGLGFNPVEGAYWRGQALIGYSRPYNELSLRGQVRFGTADQRWKNLLDLTWKGGRTYPLSISLSGGTAVQQINEDEPILPVLNSIYNLVLARNFIHLYGKDFFKLEYDSETRIGLTIGLNLEFAWRYPLFNRTNFNLVNTDAVYSPNNLSIPGKVNRFQGFDPHQSLKLEFNLSYQFNSRREVRYNQRFQEVLQGRRNLRMRAPKLYYDFKAGLPYFGATTSYAYHRLGIQHSFRWANIGLSAFDISGGHFIYENNLPFIDYQHFDGVLIFFLQPSAQRSAMIKQFSTLPYYAYSTNQAYLELHYEHNFDGALLSNVPFLRRYKVHSLIGFNSLHIADQKAFIELFFGFDNLFKVLRVEFAGGIDNFRRLRPAVRIGFDFNYDYYKQNRRS